MPIKLGQIAQWIGVSLSDGAELVINDALPLSDAGAGDIALADNSKHALAVARSNVTAVVVPRGFPECNAIRLEVASPHQAFEKIVQHFRPTRASSCEGRIHPAAFISPDSKMAGDVTIGPGATVGSEVSIGARTRIHSGAHVMDGCQIGEDCEIFPGAVLYPETRLGDRVLIHANAVLGAYGFGYRMVDGQHRRTAQLGWVEVESDCEIGAASTIDRGTYGPTRIGQGTKLDNQVQIGHNCHIGPHNLLCAQVGIAGSSSTGKYVVLGGQVGLKDHTDIGDQVMVGAQSGIMHNLPSNDTYLGSPAIPIKDEMLNVALRSKLPEFRKQIRELQRTVEQLKQQLDGQSVASNITASVAENRAA